MIWGMTYDQVKAIKEEKRLRERAKEQELLKYRFENRIKKFVIFPRRLVDGRLVCMQYVWVEYPVSCSVMGIGNHFYYISEQCPCAYFLCDGIPDMVEWRNEEIKEIRERANVCPYQHELNKIF